MAGSASGRSAPLPSISDNAGNVDPAAPLELLMAGLVLGHSAPLGPVSQGAPIGACLSVCPLGACL